MLLRLRAYRASQQKKRVSRQHKDPNVPATVLTRIEELTKKFDSLDTAAWIEEVA